LQRFNLIKTIVEAGLSGSRQGGEKKQLEEQALVGRLVEPA
jgi:hypothetical protein